MHPSTLLTFALVSIPLILAPGPSVLFAISRSLSLGKVAGVISVLGNALGALTLVAAVAFGIGLIVAQSIVIFTAVKIAGAAYLIYLGIQAIRQRNQRSDAATVPIGSQPMWRLLIQGFLVGVSNPKTIVFFIAVLPQFVDYSADSVPLQMFTLGLVFVGIAVLTDSTWALAAGAARDWFARSPKRLARLSAAGGVIMIGLGAATLFVGGAKK